MWNQVIRVAPRTGATSGDRRSDHSLAGRHKATSVRRELDRLGYAAGWQLVRAMPDGLARNLFDFGARYAARGGPNSCEKNLARVIGTARTRCPTRSCGASLMSYARYWREAFRLPSMNHVALAQRLDAVFQEPTSSPRPNKPVVVR